MAMQPMNYSLNVPNPAQAVMQGVQLAGGINQVRAVEQQTAQAEQQALINQEMQAELANLAENPTPDAIAKMMVRYPSLSENLKRGYDVMSAEQQQSRLSQGMNIYAALQNGNTGLAQELLTEQAEAYRNSGMLSQAKVMEDMARLAETSPESAATSVGVMLAGTMGPDKFVETFQAFQPAESGTEAFRTLDSRAEAAGLERGTPAYNRFMIHGGAPPEDDYNKPFLLDGSPNPAYQEYQQSLQTAGAPRTTIQMPASENEASKAYGQGIGERANLRIEAGANAQSQNHALEQMSMALAEGAKTGFGQDTLATVKNAAQSLFGLELGENTGEQEVVRALSNRLALEIRNPASGLGLPGSTSNRDLEFLSASVPNLQKTPEGNALLIDYFMKVNDFKQDVATEQQRIIDENDGVVPNNLDSQVMKFVNEYKLLDDTERAEIETLDAISQGGIQSLTFEQLQSVNPSTLSDTDLDIYIERVRRGR